MSHIWKIVFKATGGVETVWQPATCLDDAVTIAMMNDQRLIYPVSFTRLSRDDRPSAEIIPFPGSGHG